MSMITETQPQPALPAGEPSTAVQPEAVDHAVDHIPYFPPEGMAPAEVLRWQQDQFLQLKKMLVKGHDYGVASHHPGSKDVLLKPGAIKTRYAYEFSAHYDLKLDREADDHRIMIVTCTLSIRKTGEYVGEGIASGSTKDPKYFRKNVGDFQDPTVSLNAELKLTKKRALIDAVHEVIPGISEWLTQDLEDMVPADGQQPARRGGSSSRPPAKGAAPAGGGNKGRTSAPAAGTPAPIPAPPKPADGQEAMHELATRYAEGMQMATNIDDYVDVCVEIASDAEIKGSAKYMQYLQTVQVAVRKNKGFKGVAALMKSKMPQETPAPATPAEAPTTTAPTQVNADGIPIDENGEEIEEEEDDYPELDSGEVDGDVIVAQVAEMANLAKSTWMDWLGTPAEKRKPIQVPVPDTQDQQLWQEYANHLTALNNEMLATYKEHEEFGTMHAMLLEANKPGLQKMVNVAGCANIAMDVISNMTGVPK